MTTNIKVVAAKPEPSQRVTKNDYPPVPAALYDAEFESVNGTISSLANYKGKIVMVNLWGIWCGPCRDEMPRLQVLFDTYRAQGLEILGLNIGDHDGVPEAPNNIESFATRTKIGYPLSRASGAFISEFYRLTKRQVVPQTLLIDRDGHLRAVFIGGGLRVHEELRLTLEKVMAE